MPRAATARPAVGDTPTSRASVGGLLTRGSGAGWLLVLPAVLLVLGLAIPLGSVATTAFSEGGGPARDAVTDPLFVSAVWQTLKMALTVTVVCGAVGLVYSVGLLLTRGWLRVLLFGALFTTFWISLLVRTYGWIVIFQPNGILQDVLNGLGLREGQINLLQTSAAMYPGMVHIMLPYMILPILGTLSSLDPSQLRAAQSLGARPMTVFWRVVLPQLRPGIVAGTILVFILSLGFFITPRFLGGPEDLTVATVVDREFSQLYDFTAASAMGLVLLVSVLALYVIADRLFGVRKQWEHL